MKRVTLATLWGLIAALVLIQLALLMIVGIISDRVGYAICGWLDDLAERFGLDRFESKVGP